jgi:flagellar basal-body rod modification protein FlgD
MAAAAGIFSQQAAAGTVIRPMDSSSSGTGSSSSATSDSATISANDFLTLLVTEMQNQDPTADTDPNEYINQLVQVNSLEQLIGINQTLSGALGSPTTGAASDVTGQAAGANTLLSDPSQSNASGQASASAQKGSASGAASGVAAKAAVLRPALSDLVSGNLGIPAANPAADRVARALDGGSRPQPAAAVFAAR